MASGMVMRAGRPEDAAALAVLWNAAGLKFRAEYLDRELESALACGADLVLVSEEAGGSLNGSVFGTFDGRRGWVNRLATRPGHRGQGIATALMRELEHRLAARGCFKIDLLIEPENADVTSFYARLGYRQRDLIFMEKWIDDGAWDSSGLWRDLMPALHAEAYVFVTVPEPPPGAAFAVIREDEGATLVLTQDQADRAGLRYDYVAARITLTIGSALNAVGLTAAVSRVLGEAGISCNVIAGFRHDHLFVDWERGAEAAALLERL